MPMSSNADILSAGMWTIRSDTVYVRQRPIAGFCTRSLNSPNRRWRSENESEYAVDGLAIFSWPVPPFVAHHFSCSSRSELFMTQWAHLVWGTPNITLSVLARRPSYPANPRAAQGSGRRMYAFARRWASAFCEREYCRSTTSRTSTAFEWPLAAAMRIHLKAST